MAFIFFVLLTNHMMYGKLFLFLFVILSVAQAKGALRKHCCLKHCTNVFAQNVQNC